MAAAVTINFPGRRGGRGTAEDFEEVGLRAARHWHTRPGLSNSGPSTDDLDTAKANVDVGTLRAPKVGLKSCIVPINFPHGEVLSRSRAVTNAAIHIFSFKHEVPAPLKDRPAYFQGSHHPLCPPSCVSVSTFPAIICLILSMESDHKPRS